jgi:signal transduction histidine kinase/ActR/RegA family two-component response regulator
MAPDELIPEDHLIDDTEQHTGPAVAESTDVTDVSFLLQQGEEPLRIFQAILEEAIQDANCHSAALYLLDDETKAQRLSHTAGEFVPQEAIGERADTASELPSTCSPYPVVVFRYGETSYYQLPIVNTGALVGKLMIFADGTICDSALKHLRSLALYASTVFERQQLNRSGQRFLDRLNTVTQLNNLIASNASVSSLSKSIARECAFRLGADMALMLTMTADGDALEVLRGGSYGCAPNLIPRAFSLTSGILGQVLHLGDHISIQNLDRYPNHGLPFLREIGIVAINAQCLEVRGEPLGLLLVGYRREQTLGHEELVAFDEFCKASAVAIANARSQERINSYAERLQELVELRTKELEQQAAVAEEANRSKSQFLANMSHELRTPLTAIIGYSSVLKEGIFGPLNERQADALVAVIKSSEHLKNLIDDVLNLARVESGKEDPEPRAVSLEDLLTQSYKLMVQSALNKGLTLDKPELPTALREIKLYSDPKHTQQIIINLMSNAIKYTPRGGKVWLSVESVVDKVKISIHDTGVGIPPHKQATLFQRFERGDDTYSKTQEGTGIGLNLTKRLTELNGGRIGADSIQGQGSTFWIMLPLAEEDTHERLVSGAQESDKHIELSGLTTVVIDDNSDACDVLKLILTKAGATVRIAHSVQQGLELLQESAPDIILTDLAMPKESGLVLIEQVRKSAGELKDLPIIVLSACAFSADKEAALAAGASSFLAKPFQPKDILKNVRDLTFARAFTG